ncbi:MAG: phosphatase PAP2 family protein [Saprospiraceae bacterium]
MKNYFLSKSNLLLAFLVFLFITSCNKDNPETNITSNQTKTYNADIVLEWNDLFIEIDRYAPGYRPPAAARMLAYTGLAVYESVVQGMPEYKSLESQFFGLNLVKSQANYTYCWPVSANAAYASMLRNFYPHIQLSQFSKISQLEAKFNNLYAESNSKEIMDVSIAFGRSIAESVYDYSTSDVAGHKAYLNPRPSDYVPPKIGPNGEKLWQPTFPDYTAALFPYWGKVRTFAMKSSDLRAKPPIPYSEDPNSSFYQQANETRLLTNNLSFENKWICEFWSDDFFEVTFEPAGRQIAIANQLVKAKNLPLDKAVELYAKLGMAMCDASISIWNSKYIYNVRRPIEYIRDVIDPKWVTVLNHPYTKVNSITPEFPTYPSGHSGFGGSASMILTDIFGSNTSFTDNCHINRFEFIGAPRSYNNFIEAGVECAYSRIPLGVHFRMDCDEGLRLGYLAAKRVLDLPWHK